MTAVTPGAAVETMKAIVQDEYGTAPEQVLRLAEIARPAIAADEILVRVRAASVDRGTWHLMAGLAYPMRLAGFGFRAPKASNPGRSFAGTVGSAGQEVTEFKPGDEVYGTCDGSFAPYVRARAGRLAAKPASLSFEQAAAVPREGPVGRSRPRSGPARRPVRHDPRRRSATTSRSSGGPPGRAAR
jgi:NADPH:quinone reductase-like Zn-dependent oxidoreductase